MSDNQRSKTTDRPTAKAFAQQGADYTKNFAENSRAVAEETSKSMQQTYSSFVSEAANFNLQWIEMVRENTNASLDLARQLLEAKSPSEFFELSTAHTRRQFETFAQQAQQLATVAQKATAEAVKPMQASLKSAFDKAA